MYVIELQRLFVQLWSLVVTLVFPGANVAIIDVITLSFARILIFDTEVAAAGLVTVMSVTAHKFTEFKEVSGTSGIFQILIEV